MRRIFKFLSPLFLLFFQENLSAQINYSRVYGGNNYDFGSDLAATADNGVLIAATSSSYSESADILLWKIDQSGNYQWHRVYGGIWPDGASRIKLCSDSGFVIGGYRTIHPSSGYDFWLLRTNNLGDTLWSRSFGTSLWDECTDVIQTSDKGFFMVGTTWDSELSDKDILMVKTDSSGNLLWQQVYSTDGPDTVSQALEVNGKLYLMGSVYHPDSMRNIAITVFDNNGQFLWSRQYGSSQNDIGNGICLTSSNELMICGAAQMVAGNPYYQLYIHKLDIAGNPIWANANHSYDNFNWNFTRIAEVSGGRSMMFGAVDVTGNYANWDLDLGRFDANGFPQLATTYGSFLKETPGGMVLHPNGEISVVGTTRGFTNGLDNIYYVRVDSTLITAVSPGIQVNVKNNIINDDKVSIFPNPSAGFFNVTGLQTDDIWLLFDAMGRQIMTGKFSAAPNLDLSDLNNGLYFLHVAGVKQSFVRPLVIRK
ncbi:MAG: hypothetical protein RLZZ46_177 [Bacteroidota bacterium]|jgi:hypothetical protein